MNLAILTLGMFGTLGTPAITPPSGQGALLSTVPEDAYAVARCIDPETLEQRIRENEWGQYLGTPGGDPFWGAFDAGAGRVLDTGSESVVSLGKEIDREVVLFATERGVGFVAEPPPSRDRLLAALRAFLPDDADAAPRAAVTIAGATVQLVVRPQDESRPWRDRMRVRALVDHPGAIGLFTGDDERSVTELLRESLGGLGTARRAPVTLGLSAARDAVGPLDIELYVDGSAFAEDAERTLERAGRSMLPFFFDPRGLLGLEEDTWVYSTVGVYPGRRLEWRTRVNLPAGGLVAQLADTLRPLPGNLLAGIPADTWMVDALNWDFVACYDLVRAALKEAERDDEMTMVDQTLDMAEQATGVDVEQQIIRQLSGTFAFYLGELQEPAEGERFDLGVFDSAGFQAYLRDGALFREAFEILAKDDIAREGVQRRQVAGGEVFADEKEPWSFGILPDRFLVSMNRDLLEGTLNSIEGEPGASLASGTSFEGAFGENRGAFAFFAVDLGELRKAQQWYEPEHAEGSEAAPDPFLGELVGSAHRTRSGLDLRAYTR